MLVEDLDDQTRFRKILEVPYNDLAGFIFEYLKKRTKLIYFFFFACILTLIMAIAIRLEVSQYYHYPKILLHTILGTIIFPFLVIPVHEILHIIPFRLSGATNIRVGMDLKQYLFYVTAHRYVANPVQFRLVAILPFLVISLLLLILILYLPGLWKWSISLFFFFHTTMCAGDFALLNFYSLNNDKKIFTWDDADKKIAYFYEELR